VPIRVLLADDEPLARRRLLRFLHAEPDVDVVAECAGGESALAALRDREVDLAILDVQMPDADGFQVVASFGAERMPAVIFVTAYDEYAVRAFEVHALDYLLKPVTAERFGEAFRRARRHLERDAAARTGERLRALLAQVMEEEPAAAPSRGGEGSAAGAAASAGAGPLLAPLAPLAPTRYADRLTVKGDGRVFLVRVSDVDWIEAHGNYVRVHAGSATHLIRDTISALERSLNPAHFARIHRSTIVNLDRIREMQPWFAGDYVVILRDGTRLKLTRTYRDQLQARLNGTG
jgi:two-component system LytT family response regulator